MIKKAIKRKIPIFGICRGAQLLNLKFGGKISKVKNQMRTRHNIYFNKNDIIKNILNVKIASIIMELSTMIFQKN